MKAIDGYFLIKPDDRAWRPSNIMRIPNADFLESLRGARRNPVIVRRNVIGCTECFAPLVLVHDEYSSPIH